MLVCKAIKASPNHQNNNANTLLASNEYILTKQSARCRARRSCCPSACPVSASKAYANPSKAYEQMSKPLSNKALVATVLSPKRAPWKVTLKNTVCKARLRIKISRLTANKGRQFCQANKCRQKFSKGPLST